MVTPPKPLVRRTIVSVLCLHPEEDAILLVEQAKPGAEPRWALPGGTWEIDESAEEAAVREVREETGLDVRLVGLYDSRVEVREREETRVAVFILTYEACWVGGELVPRDPDDHVLQAAWVPFSRLDSLPFAHPEQRQLIERFLAERRPAAWRAVP